MLLWGGGEVHGEAGASFCAETIHLFSKMHPTVPLLYAPCVSNILRRAQFLTVGWDTSDMQAKQ